MLFVDLDHREKTKVVGNGATSPLFRRALLVFSSLFIICNERIGSKKFNRERNEIGQRGLNRFTARS
jgi:hypothetical protein